MILHVRQSRDARLQNLRFVRGELREYTRNKVKYSNGGCSGLEPDVQIYSVYNFSNRIFILFIILAQVEVHFNPLRKIVNRFSIKKSVLPTDFA